MKVCCRCKKEKDENEFGIQSRYYKTKTGEARTKTRRHECKECYNEYMRAYLKDRDSHKKLVKNSKNTKKEHVDAIKTKRGCEKCGYNKCLRALHFHHVDKNDKNFEISWAIKRGISIKKIDEEISRCILLCSNCHFEIEDEESKM